jgi:hypothetical protein
MRAYVIGFISACGLAISVQTAETAPLSPAGRTVAPVTNNLPAATHNCGKGQRWVPGGYARHGKYRAGHCAPA